jgi:Rrf2 family protein
MKLSTKSKYGIRAMLVLATSPVGEVIMAKRIAEVQQLPETYLEQLMLILRKAELVIALRGAKGGYMLARSPKSITLAEVVEALEGPVDIADCANVPNCSAPMDACALQEVFARVNDAILGELKSATLASLAERQTTLEHASSLMYYI